MSHAAQLLLALGLDAVLGEPRALWSRVPHPVVAMGRAVGVCDRRWNHGRARRAKGAVCLATLVLAAGLLGAVLAALPGGAVFEVAAASVLLAHRSLVDHVGEVARALRLSPGEGRRAVARIVGRDTAAMDAPAVARAAIESAAENFSDGVVAPAFWFLVFGLPGLLVYKLVNTADSMIGYRTPRHAAFGWAAARADDVLNWLPARATALIFAAISGQLAEWEAIAADARRHRSPNAGWPEAALARALGVALAGPRSYEGRMRDFAFVNPTGRRDVGPAEVEAALRALWRLWAGIVAICLLLAAS